MKLYYSIGEVAEMLGVNASLLRYWESEFSQLKPRKTSNGTRTYTQKDIDLLRRIYHLTKEKGFTLEGARDQLRHKEGSDVVIDRLLDARQQLVELQQQLQQMQ